MNLFTLPLVALAISFTISAQAQTVHGLTGAGARMQGGASAVLDDAFAVINNPSQLSRLRQWQSGVYHERRFNRKELALSSVCVAVPNRIADAGVGFSSFGFSDFSEQRLILSASKKLAQTLSLGVQANYVVLGMNEYGRSATWVLGAGVSYQPTPKISIGFVVYNPNQRQLPAKAIMPVRIPALARAGVQYRVNNKVYTVAEADLQITNRMLVKGGIRYEAHPRVSIAIGAATGDLLYTFGTSVKFAGTAIDMAAGYHPVFGTTPQLSLRYPAANH